MSVGVVHSGSADDYTHNNSSGGGGGGGGGLQIDLESIRLTTASMVARIQSRVSMDTLRSLPVFLGVDPTVGFCLAGGAFTPPVKKVDKSSLEKIKSRVALNWNFFLSNYVLVAAMTAVVVALMHPGMLFFVAAVYGLWSLHSFMIRNELAVFGLQLHSLLSVQQRFYLLFVLTTLVVVWKCLAPAIIFLSISSILILSHAFLRDPKHIEYTSDLLLNQSDDEYENEDDDEERMRGSSSGSSSEVIVERPSTTRRGDVI